MITRSIESLRPLNILASRHASTLSISPIPPSKPQRLNLGESSNSSKQRSSINSSSSLATTFPAPAERKATHHFIKLQRSAIALPERYRATIKALGLRKRHSVVLQPFHKLTAGQILRVKELVDVRNVTKEEGEAMVERERNKSEGSGVEPTGVAFGGGRTSICELTSPSNIECLKSAHAETLRSSGYVLIIQMIG